MRVVRGFTLIELMVVIVVASVLMAIAVPSYFDQVKRARRADAREALSDLATRQEQFFLDNKAYTNVSQ
ncbi:MAG: prepilin-type N-terminal cleavage/methylation domain-containing protein, partial [Gammaproteobacteria bacterium]|nr:prepilin-type N-terminal cleavage/methylation domain-containing protein [Gammaproteobacteria bacterium]